MELRWYDLETEPVPEDFKECVILFPQISDVGILYEASNSEYAKQNALKHGYTHWFPIPRHSDTEKIEEKIKEIYKDD